MLQAWNASKGLAFSTRQLRSVPRNFLRHVLRYAKHSAFDTARQWRSRQILLQPCSRHPGLLERVLPKHRACPAEFPPPTSLELPWLFAEPQQASIPSGRRRGAGRPRDRCNELLFSVDAPTKMFGLSLPARYKDRQHARPGGTAGYRRYSSAESRIVRHSPTGRGTTSRRLRGGTAKGCKRFETFKRSHHSSRNALGSESIERSSDVRHSSFIEGFGNSLNRPRGRLHTYSLR